MNRLFIPALIGLFIIHFINTGCMRSDPPEVTEFKPPKKVEEERKVVQVADTGEALPDEKKPEPQPEAKPEAKPERKPEPKPEEKKEDPKQDPQGPSIIGTWKMVSMERDGQSMDMPPEMNITMTFQEGGTMTMRQEHSQMPEANEMEGTYTIDGDQLSITVMGDTKSGAFEFDGANTLYLNIEGRVKLERQ